MSVQVEPTSTQTHAFALLDGHQYMNLTTFRKNDTEVTRPVWFARQGDTIYFISQQNSGKVKHIRNNPDVLVSPSDVRGNPLSDERTAGVATIHEKGSEAADRANQALNQKYGIQKRLFSIVFILRRDTIVWGEIVPADA